MEMKEIAKLCENCFGSVPKQIVRLAGAGSARRYYRVAFGDCAGGAIPGEVIATVGDDVRENEVFCALAGVFGRKAQECRRFRVPQIFAIDGGERRCYLQESFGSCSLFDMIKCKGADSPEVENAVKSALDGLLEIQSVAPAEWEDVAGCRPFGERRVRWDLNYFKYAFIKPCGIMHDEERLEDDFERMAAAICDYPKEVDGFMYRDFQSRNVMWEDGKAPGFIDFQGGMRGPGIYDAVSMLWQAKAGFGDGFRRRMMDYYLEGLSRRSGLLLAQLQRLVDGFVLLRTLQVLGAYGFRGLIEKKAHFIESIPPALANLRSQLDRGVLHEWPELERCCREAVEMECFRPKPEAGLTIEVWSFSFKKGYPENMTGNGGGFVFDCRGMHNPGRYDEYKPLTGLDLPVRDFLESRGETEVFLNHAAGMVYPAIEAYMRRGFTHLQVAFGCTGGRHRSVYCADVLSSRIHEAFPGARVRVIHREQGLDKIL